VARYGADQTMVPLVLVMVTFPASVTAMLAHGLV
jgi:hypothetical protein